MKKTIYIGVCALIVVLLIIIGVFAFPKNETEKKNTMKNMTILNETNNEQKEERNTEQNEIMENEIDNTIANEEVTNNTITEPPTSSETLEESPKTAKEKAIAVVKKDWKENSNVEFSVDGMDENGNYIVAVRNSQTTEALAFYRVNISNETFTKKEMN